MTIWFLRRRPPLWARIARVALLVSASTGAAIGLEVLRRRLGLGTPRVELERDGRRTRMRVTLPRSRRRRAAAGSRS